MTIRWWWVGALACCGGDDEPDGSGRDGGVDAATEQDSGAQDAGQDAEVIVPGEFVSLDPETVLEAESHVAAHEDGTVLVAWMAARAWGDGKELYDGFIGWALSRDRGVSWSARGTLEAPGRLVGGDPVVAVDSAGQYYVAWLGMASFWVDMHLYVARLDPGADAFGPAVEVAPPERSFVDKPWIAVDPDDDLLVAWHEFDFPEYVDQELFFARSSDGGESFERSTVTTLSTYDLNMPVPCVDASEPRRILLPYVDQVSGNRQERVMLAVSDDGGAGWDLSGEPLATDSMFIGPTCVAHDGHVWITYAAGPAEDLEGHGPADAVRVLHSDDQGETFETIDVTETAGASVVFPSLARAPTGILEIAYYELAADGPIAFRSARSTDDGAHWTSTTIAEVGDATTASAHTWLGDYVGLAYADGWFFGAFAAFDETACMGSSPCTHVRVERWQEAP